MTQRPVTTCRSSTAAIATSQRGQRRGTAGKVERGKRFEVVIRYIGGGSRALAGGALPHHL
jgi:hypothetical protein